MREKYAVIFLCLIFALAVCAVTSLRSRKSIGKYVSLLQCSLIPPVIGNLILIISGDRAFSTAGCMIYFIGMDLVMFALCRHTVKYCRISVPNRKLMAAVDILLAADIIQLLCNPIFGHAFNVEAIEVDGFDYYRIIPLLGQTIHRAIDYAIIAAIIVIYIVKVVRAPQIYAERYYVILATMIAATLWQTFYIFSRTPIDRSMIGFGIFGLLIYYFSLLYRPLRLLDRLLASMASEMNEALFFFDLAGRCIWVNGKGVSLLRIGADEFDRASGKLSQVFGELKWDSDNWSCKRIAEIGGDLRYFVIERRTVTYAQDRPAGSFIIIRDETEEQLRLKREIYNATHDALTGLYTREFLYEHIRETIASHPDIRYYVIFADVKNFKIINDIFSNTFGDFTLKCVAEKIRENVPDKSVYGRLGGDNFGILIPVADFNRSVFEDNLSHFAVNDGSVEYNLLIHFGVYEVTETDIDVSVMFDRAHLALATIKDEYQNHIAFYDDEIRRKVLWDQHISAQLFDAIQSFQIRPYLQPIVDCKGKVVGAEALARWIHPVDGFLSPISFIPVFENNGMIVEIDKHMWRSACEILSRWKKTRPDLFISVNISPKDFYFIDVASELRGLIKEYGIEPASLRIEITETVMMNDAEDRMKILSDFRDEGFIVEMDDFGSGYSSLSLLKDMPVDVLKIDMKFLGKSQNYNKAHRIVQNIITMSDDLDISSLTEGVENAEQYNMLSEMGCRLFQGYYFAKPLPVDEFEEFCSSRSDNIA